MSEGTVEVTLVLKKPLEKMTAKELRAMVMEQVPQITGVSGMGKDEIIARIKEVFGMEDEESTSISPYKDRIHKLKRQIRDLRAGKDATEDRKQKDVLRRKIHNLKKQTRRLANA